MAGRPRGEGAVDTNVISMEIKVFAGGLDYEAKQHLIEQVTEAVRHHAGIEICRRAPVYIVLMEVAPENWGVFGSPITLESLSNTPVDAAPL